EVGAVLSQFPGPAVVNVYGVRVPGNEGRAGMVALTYANPASFDPRAFHEFAVARLAGYAVPLFVRVSCEAELTTTFKLRKIDLPRALTHPLQAGKERSAARRLRPSWRPRCAVRARFPGRLLCPRERRCARRP